MEQVQKIEGISPDMLWTFCVVLVGLMALVVLGHKVIEIFRKEHDRKLERKQLDGQDITERIADKVMEKLQPRLDEQFTALDKRLEDVDKKLASDKEELALHTHQLNDHESRVSRLEGGNKALCHGMLALLEQNPSLIRAQNAMKNYLIDGTYKEDDWK